MSQATRKAGTGRRGRGGGQRVRLRPANPFDLIRLIAHSQSDPRKALAELVQNSLDAEARSITITRRRHRGEIQLSVFDDGRGIFPEEERPAALEKIATNIGHSFKKNLSAAERQRQMLLGKYGIGILGFWCVGRELEMRTRVAGSDVWSLRLVEDDPDAEVRKLPQRSFPFDAETCTEIVVQSVHPAAARVLSSRRLGDYLGSELRGQLLARDVKLRIIDRVARGKAVKDFLVVPQRFQGRRLPQVDELAVEGRSPARVELYLVDEQEERPARVSLCCGGTVVCEDLSQVEGYALDPALWGGRRLEGIIEFAELEVAPGTRRGFLPGPEADAFFEALRALEPRLRAVLEEEGEKRRAEQDQNLAQEIRRVFRPLARALPQYDFFEIARSSPQPDRAPGSAGAQLGRAEEMPAEEPSSEVVESGEEPEPPPELFPPGPLESVRIAPRRSRLLPGATRGLTAKAFDEAGRRIEAPLEFLWSLREGGGSLSAEEDRAAYTAPEETGAAAIVVLVRQGDIERQAEAEIEIVERLRGENPDAGIPDPKRVFDPEGDWRSRIVGARWEYNAAHRDYQSVVDDPRRRLRYLVHLFSKEIVLRNWGEPKDERLLERMVEVLTHIRARS
ncbi:MAG: ATP-binding protein [Planctomycetes bacterium]|nr:ATP-binding protein [Planctomycetota bacterium]